MHPNLHHYSLISLLLLAPLLATAQWDIGLHLGANYTFFKYEQTKLPFFNPNPVTDSLNVGSGGGFGGQLGGDLRYTFGSRLTARTGLRLRWQSANWDVQDGISAVIRRPRPAWLSVSCPINLQFWATEHWYVDGGIEFSYAVARSEVPEPWTPLGYGFLFGAGLAPTDKWELRFEFSRGGRQVAQETDPTPIGSAPGNLYAFYHDSLRVYWIYWL